MDAPRNATEVAAAQQAILRERYYAEGDALVDALTDRERALIQVAWDAGVREARSALSERLNAPHAVTLDAASVARTVASWHSDSLHLDDDWWCASGHHDPRVVALVRTVERMLHR